MPDWYKSFLAGLVLAGAASAVAAAPTKSPPPGEYLPPTLSWLRQVEAVQMLGAIVSGTPLMSGDVAWFHPSQSRYSFRWLAGRFDRDHDGAVSRAEFPGSSELFDRLDRNHDGRLTPADFDWSPQSPLTRQMQIVNSLFRRADTDKNERISSAEWQGLFKEASKGKDGLTREELHALLFPPPPPPPKGPPKGPPDRGPTLFTLVKGVLTGELGSLCEGPAVGQLAPDFTLRTHDGDREITLSDFRGHKPVVLVFGSFT